MESCDIQILESPQQLGTLHPLRGPENLGEASLSTVVSRLGSDPPRPKPYVAALAREAYGRDPSLSLALDGQLLQYLPRHIVKRWPKI